MGFDAAFGGTDYSLSSSPILTVTDAAGTGTTTITSATGGFTVLMQGNGINVNGNLYQIITRTSNTAVVVDRVTGIFSGQTAKVGGAGGAKGTVTSALEPQEYGVLVPGNVIWIKGPTYSIVAGVHVTTSGLEENYIRVEGYGTTRGDGIIADMGQVGTWSGAYTTIKNLRMAGTFGGGTLFVGAAGQFLENIIVDATGTGGYAITVSALVVFRRGWIKGGNSAAAVRDTSGSLYEFVRVDGGTGQPCFSVESGQVRLNNCITNGGAVGVQINANSATVQLRNSLFFGASSYGLDITPTSLHFDQGSIVEGNIFDTNGLYDIAWRQITPNPLTGQGAQNWIDSAFKCNFFHTTGTGRYLNMSAASSDTSLTISPSISPGTGNFNLNVLAGGGLVVAASPCTETIPDSAIIGGSVNSSTILSGPAGTAPVIPAPPPPTDTANMRTLWREWTNERNTVVVPDTVVDMYLDSGLQEINRQVSYYYITDTTSLTMVVGQQEYPLPEGLLELVWVQYGTQRLLEKGSIEQWRGLNEDWRNEPPALPRYYAHYGQNLVLRPAPSAAAVDGGANLTFRYIGTPPSLDASAPLQADLQMQRLAVMYGVAQWSSAFPDSALAKDRLAFFQAAFDKGVSALQVQYSRRGISR